MKIVGVNAAAYSSAVVVVQCTTHPERAVAVYFDAVVATLEQLHNLNNIQCIHIQ